MEKVELVTPRIRLRAPTLDDVPAITAACQDRELQRRVPIPVPYGTGDARAYVTGFSDAGWAAGRHCTWALEVDETFARGFAGVVSIDGIAGGSAELGYWMARQYRGFGLMSEAAAAAVAFAFARVGNGEGESAGHPDSGLGLMRLGWRAFADNRASASVAQKLGFRYEGTARSGAVGREGREDEWRAGLLASDDRAPQEWEIFA